MDLSLWRGIKAKKNPWNLGGKREVYFNWKLMGFGIFPAPDLRAGRGLGGRRRHRNPGRTKVKAGKLPVFSELLPKSGKSSGIPDKHLMHEVCGKDGIREGLGQARGRRHPLKPFKTL